MAHPLNKVVEHIRTIAVSQGASDGELLRSFVTSDDQRAFAALVKRHGPLVFSVCKRVLGVEDAEDAFQGSFVVLARNAAKLPRGCSLSTWLHGVAYRIALNARRLLARRRRHERQAKTMAATNPALNAAWREVLELLDEEIQRLPEQYREPFILCSLEGQSYAAAARRMDLKETTVRGRLMEARKRLQKRLSKRGVELTAVLGAAALAPNAARAQVAPALVAKAVSAATGAAVPASVNVLVMGLTAALAIKKAKVGVVLFLVFSGLVGTASMWAVQQQPGEKEKSPVAQAAGKHETEIKAEPAVAKDIYGDPLPEGAIARLGTKRFRHGGFVPFVGFLPDGKSLVSAGTEGPVIVRELATGQELRRFNRQKVTEYVEGAIALSPKGELLICSGQLLQIYNSATGEKLAEIKTKGQPAVEVALAPDGNSLATIRLDGSISLYDRATLKEMHHINQPDAPEKFQRKRRMASLAFSPDGKLLASVDYEGPASECIRLWDTTTGKEIRRVKDGLGEPPLPRSPSFSPDGKLLAWIDIHGTARVRNLATGNDVAQLSFVIGFTFTPDSKSLVTHNSDQTGIGVLKIENSSAHRVAAREEIPQWVSWSRDFQPRQPVAISPDGKVVAVAGEQNQIRLIDLGTGQDRFANRGQRFPVSWLSYSRNGKILTTWGTGDKMWQWDVATGNMIRNVVLPAGLFSHVAISPDNKLLATVGMMMSKRDRFEIWDTATGASLHELGKPAPGTITPTAAFSPRW